MSFSITRNEIIEEAIAELGALDPSNAPDGHEISRAEKRLNMMIDGWMADGCKLWRRTNVTVFVNPSQSVYTFGTDHITESYVETTLSADAAAAAATISVSSAAGISKGDFIGIKNDSQVVEWDTVKAVDGTTVTLTGTLSEAAGADNAVYAYTAKAASPKKVLAAYRRNTSGNDTRVFIQGRLDYEELSNKDSDGEITQIHHEPLLTGSTITVWPRTSATTDKLVLTVDRAFTSFSEASSTPDFPAEWFEALYMGLANRLAPVYGLEPLERREIERRAYDVYERSRTYDQEEASLKLELDLSGR